MGGLVRHQQALEERVRRQAGHGMSRRSIGAAQMAHNEHASNKIEQEGDLRQRRQSACHVCRHVRRQEQG